MITCKKNIKKGREIIFLIITMFLLSGHLCGQNKNTIIVSSGTKIIDNFPPWVRYMYPQFVKGQVVLQNGLYSDCIVNYNMLIDEIEFIQDNDTLIIGKKRDLQYVIVGVDTFVYTPGYMKNASGFVQLIRGQKLKIYSKDRFYLKEILKRGAMGTVNRTAAIGSFGDFDEGGFIYSLVATEDYVFRRELAYYISTSSGTLEPFKKRNILKLFSFHKKEVRKYIKTNKINFGKQEDIIKLADFLSAL